MVSAASGGMIASRSRCLRVKTGTRMSLAAHVSALMEMLREAEGEGHQRKCGELRRAVGKDGRGGDEEIAKAVYAEVGIDDAGVRVYAHDCSAHCVTRVVEIGDGSSEIRCEEGC